MKLRRLTVLVHDYEEALGFYVGKLGLRVIADQVVPPYRFLHVGDSEDGLGLWLWLADEENRYLVGRQALGHPLLVFYTDDCVARHRALVEKGVVFKREPAESNGHVVAQFIDLYGNEMILVEVKQTEV
jgi:catechol 2,3-dioxygenase-like lactoylglutathione lyase family enzyme